MFVQSIEFVLFKQKAASKS